jgi:hypothetical protein
LVDVIDVIDLIDVIDVIDLISGTEMAIPAGWVGLALSFSFEMTAFLKHCVRMYAQLEAAMNSVERVQFYS